jgi:hypothetical protein
MTKKIIGPRKQRTRQHVLADKSVNHVERFIIDEGHTSQSFSRDYGYDLLVSTYNGEGYLEPGSIYLQLKAAESLKRVGSAYVFDVDIRDYNLWTLERSPVILILFDASRRRAYWLHIQDLIRQSLEHSPKKGAKTVRVHVPGRQGVNRRAVAKWRELKWQARGRMIGEQA